MNRCPSKTIACAALALASVLAPMLWPATASAQPAQGVRQFPANALRATLRVTAPPEVLLNGAPARLAPGARIRGVTNTLVMSASLVGETYIVNYLPEKQGLIQEIWLLTEAEVAEKRRGMEPVTNFVFESMGNKPRVDDGKTPYHQLPGLGK